MDLEELYDRFGDRAFHYLYIKLGSAGDAEDVLQEVFYRLARYSIRLKFIRRPAAFVFQIARNEANRFLKKKIHEKKSCQRNAELCEIIRTSISGPDEESVQILSASLAKLPEEQREIIILKFFEGLTFKEIASACGLSINTAASRYRYGLAKLRSLMEGKL
jgi:RNA polymerase sigma-70 factor (ECF subfamily)